MSRSPAPLALAPIAALALLASTVRSPTVSRAASAPPTVAIVHATLINPNAPPVRDAVVVFEGGRVKCAGRGPRVRCRPGRRFAMRRAATSRPVSSMRTSTTRKLRGSTAAPMPAMYARAIPTTPWSRTSAITPSDSTARICARASRACSTWADIRGPSPWPASTKSRSWHRACARRAHSCPRSTSGSTSPSNGSSCS